MDENGEHELKWCEPGSVSEVPHVFSHMWHIALKQKQQYYETLVTLRKCHMQEG
jgi:hypothetical protein